MDSRKVFRSLLKDGHDRMKWVSSSILFGHSLQKRFSLGVGGFVRRPDFIARQWSLNLSFVIFLISNLFCTSSYHFFWYCCWKVFFIDKLLFWM